MSDSSPLDQLSAMKDAFTALEGLDADGRQSALGWLADALGVKQQATRKQPLDRDEVKTSAEEAAPAESQSPKEFIANKRPSNDVQRVACLAYYLTHVRGVKEFKTKEITDLNTEAAGHRFGNASQAVTNALKVSGFLAQGAKSGTKQITPRGDSVVEAMPDPEAVKQAMAEFPAPRRTAKKKSGGNSK